MKINFFAGENKFIYGKKFSGIREKILRHTGRNNFPCGRKFHGSQYSLIVMRFTINFNAVYNRLATAVQLYRPRISR